MADEKLIPLSKDLIEIFFDSLSQLEELHA